MEFLQADQEWNWHSKAPIQGITSFTYNNKSFIAWGAAGGSGKSFIMIASWDGQKISDVSGIQ
jgi:hypothetical protein